MSSAAHIAPGTAPEESHLALKESICQGRFVGLDDKDAVHLLHGAFGPELERLRNATAASELGNTGFSPVESEDEDDRYRRSPSRQLFGADHDEVNRTLTAMLALKWILSANYGAFSRCQTPSTRLRQESFEALKQYFDDVLLTPEDVYSLLVAVVVNDLGKDPGLAEEIAARFGKNLNHDIVVYEAAKADLIPCMRQLDPNTRDNIMLGLQMGSELNAAQLAQAENVPGNLEGLLKMRGHGHAFSLKFLELLLDVSGAVGHVDGSCAKMLTEPVFQTFMAARDALVDIMAGQSTLRAGYDRVLLKRDSMLRETGFRALSISQPEERALLRLLTMGRTIDKAQAELFAGAFYALPQSTRKQLVDGLSVDGYEDGTAILPYYMPAMMSEGIKNMGGMEASAQQDGLGSLMRFLARVVRGTKPSPGQPGVIKERNLLFARDTIRSEAFRKNPSVLDDLQFPAEGSDTFE
ncbi:MAG: hypothetical protein M1815_005436 [Lichina confinis]|nr:MAG: hypothetical protein M1815_005436 [Lichina confinis]